MAEGYENNGYKWLEFKPHPWKRTPEIKGTGINVGTLFIQYNAWGCYKNLEELADDRDLPLEAVQEAYDWYSKNRDLVTEECIEERKRLGVKD